VVASHLAVLRRQQLFGYTEEELRVLLTPMATAGAEGTGSMGSDTPEAVLSARPRMLFDYFTQLFAQVTNPPLDAIREAVVTSMESVIGPESNLLEPGPASCRQILLPFPVLDNDDVAKLVGINDDGNLPGYQAAVIAGHYTVAGGGAGWRPRSRGCGPRWTRRSPAARASSCSPTGTPTPITRPSRRCCSPPPCTST
jgi:glutamate synthase (NADPH/NADH) large chain